MRFGGGASFVSATFGDWARFDSTTFGDVASFESATFGDRASFDSTTFGDGLSFLNTRFGAYAGIARAHVRPPLRRESWFDRRWLERRFLQRFDWQHVRSVGELAILTRVSYFALILVPIVAGVWPALRSAANWANDDLRSAAARIEKATYAFDHVRQAPTTQAILREAGERLGNEAAALSSIGRELADKLGHATVLVPQMPVEWLFAFLAAAAWRWGTWSISSVPTRRCGGAPARRFGWNDCANSGMPRSTAGWTCSPGRLNGCARSPRRTRKWPAAWRCPITGIQTW